MRAFGVAVGLGLAVCGLAEAGQVRIVEEDREFLTYPFGDPDPVPAVAQKRYPYFRYDGSAANGVTQRWHTVVLENEHLRVTLMPEIGGKVWGAVDKRTGVDFVYFNHVVKFRDIAMRGPWVSGGIEFNFGILGHAPSSATPVRTLGYMQDVSRDKVPTMDSLRRIVDVLAATKTILPSSVSISSRWLT